jgi:hypothetical protein
MQGHRKILTYRVQKLPTVSAWHIRHISQVLAFDFFFPRLNVSEEILSMLIQLDDIEYAFIRAVRQYIHDYVLYVCTSILLCATWCAWEQRAGHRHMPRALRRFFVINVANIIQILIVMGGLRWLLLKRREILLETIDRNLVVGKLRTQAD